LLTVSLTYVIVCRGQLDFRKRGSDPEMLNSCEDAAVTEIERTNDIDVLSQWIGKSQTSSEVVSIEHCTRVANTLGVSGAWTLGDPLPPLWHFTLHLGSVPTGQLGSDGHAERGGFLPPVALPRRMWAGGRIRFPGDIHVGDTVDKTSTIHDIVMKQGRSGQLCFVTVVHALRVEGELRIEEEQDLVFRDAPNPDTPAPSQTPAPDESELWKTIDPVGVLLFRYSALTFNAHRIHYDRDYARDVEGYDGLIVHGPLLATQLAGLAVEHGGPLESFGFRSSAPLFDTSTYSIHATSNDAGTDVWVANAEDNVTMRAEATHR